MPGPEEFTKLIVDFMATAVITSIRTQGAFNQETWVIDFTVAYLYRDNMYPYQKVYD